MNVYVFMNVHKCILKITRLVLTVSEVKCRINRKKADFAFNCLGFIFLKSI